LTNQKFPSPRTSSNRATQKSWRRNTSRSPIPISLTHNTYGLFLLSQAQRPPTYTPSPLTLQTVPFSHIPVFDFVLSLSLATASAPGDGPLNAYLFLSSATASTPGDRPHHCVAYLFMFSSKYAVVCAYLFMFSRRRYAVTCAYLFMFSKRRYEVACAYLCMFSRRKYAVVCAYLFCMYTLCDACSVILRVYAPCAWFDEGRPNPIAAGCR